MIGLWIAAALMSAALAALVLARAAAAAKTTARQDEDPTLAVYRRQLVEIDDLADRGLLAPDEHRSTRTEAARRLLSAADSSTARWRESKGERLGLLVIAGLSPLLAVGAYLAIGSPRLPDQPFKQRVEAWRKGDPTALDAAQMAAVLQDIVAQNPGDVRPLVFLARAQAAAGDNLSAERNLQKALTIQPNRSELWGFYGQLLAADAGGDSLPADAKAAFEKARSLDPQAPEPRYFLARGQIAAGDVAGGLKGLRDLEASLSPMDPRRPVLAQQIAAVERTGALPPPQDEAARGAAGGQQAFIQRMVQGLAARLAAQPDDPAGWARLVRSYGVLGETAQRDAALAKARVLFHDRPRDLALIEPASAPGP
jgi:cytochrome c-type biogenesis protein CcmH